MNPDGAGGVVALVPVRGLRGGKTRLAGALSAEAREALTRRMLRTVVCAAVESNAVGTVAVVSPDPVTLALAREFGPGVVPLAQDPAAAGLNPALEAGRAWAERRGATMLLVLFGDLPLLAAQDVRHLVALGREAPVVLAPDRHGSGTNALLVRADPVAPNGDRFRFRFGPGSLSRHLGEASRLGLEIATVDAPGTAFDLDTPGDLRELMGAGGAWCRVEDSLVGDGNVTVADHLR